MLKYIVEKFEWIAVRDYEIALLTSHEARNEPLTDLLDCNPHSATKAVACTLFSCFHSLLRRFAAPAFDRLFSAISSPIFCTRSTTWRTIHCVPLPYEFSLQCLAQRQRQSQPPPSCRHHQLLRRNQYLLLPRSLLRQQGKLHHQQTHRRRRPLTSRRANQTSMPHRQQREWPPMPQMQQHRRCARHHPLHLISHRLRRLYQLYSRQQ